MAVLATTDLSLPPHMASGVFEAMQYGSTVAALVGASPMLFGESEYMTFSNPKAEFVGEGAQKANSDVTPSTVTVKPYKAQVTMRFNEEVQWADEDYQLGVLNQLSDKTGPALARALDFGIYHGLNPLSGTAFAPMTVFLSQTTNSVESTGDQVAEADAAALLVLADGYIPTGLALDPTYAAPIAFVRDTEGRKVYPDFNLSGEAFQWEGFRTAMSDTVSAIGTADVDTDVKAFTGDFARQIVWGVQRRIGVELIRYGDPDGQGDLKRNNQIALRSEVVYGWAIGDLDAFAKVIDAV